MSVPFFFFWFRGYFGFVKFRFQQNTVDLNPFMLFFWLEFKFPKIKNHFFFGFCTVLSFCTVLVFCIFFRFKVLVEAILKQKKILVPYFKFPYFRFRFGFEDILISLCFGFIYLCLDYGFYKQ